MTSIETNQPEHAPNCQETLDSPLYKRLQEQLEELREALITIAQGWRSAARSVHQPNSPSIYVECAEELEAVVNRHGARIQLRMRTRCKGS